MLVLLFAVLVLATIAREKVLKRGGSADTGITATLRAANAAAAEGPNPRHARQTPTIRSTLHIGEGAGTVGKASDHGKGRWVGEISNTRANYANPMYSTAGGSAVGGGGGGVGVTAVLPGAERFLLVDAARGAAGSVRPPPPTDKLPLFSAETSADDARYSGYAPPANATHAGGESQQAVIYAIPMDGSLSTLTLRSTAAGTAADGVRYLEVAPKVVAEYDLAAAGDSTNHYDMQAPRVRRAPNGQLPPLQPTSSLSRAPASPAGTTLLGGGREEEVIGPKATSQRRKYVNIPNDAVDGAASGGNGADTEA